MEKTVAVTQRRRVFLTGAFGMVGEWVLREFLTLGCEVTCFDKRSPLTEKKQKRLKKSLRFATIWGDLTQSESVMSALGTASPSLIVHVAAIIPPLSIKNPDLARRVNVEGTQNLVSAAKLLTGLDRLVSVSSYSVHGPCNPHRDPAPWTSETPLNPQDDYAKQKAEAEQIIRASGLPTCIVRLCAVFPIQLGDMDPDASRFSLLLPYDRREHAIDVRDAALAIVNAAGLPNLNGRTFNLGGGEGWCGTGGELGRALMASLGLKPLPPQAYRRADPMVDASWFYENWVDTTESEAALHYQQHSFKTYLADLRRGIGAKGMVLKLLAGSIQKKSLKQSPFYADPSKVDSRPFVEAARAFFNSQAS